MRPRAFSRPRLSQGRLNVSIESRLFTTLAMDRRGETSTSTYRRATSSEIQTVRTLKMANPHVSIIGPRVHSSETVARIFSRNPTVVGCVLSVRSLSAEPRRVFSNDKQNDRSTFSRKRESRHRLRPEIRRDYPLNLSILISGGKETNQDSLSNGE